MTPYVLILFLVNGGAGDLPDIVAVEPLRSLSAVAPTRLLSAVEPERPLASSTVE